MYWPPAEGLGALRGPDPPDSEPTRVAFTEERTYVSKNRRSFTPEYKDEAAKMVIELQYHGRSHRSRGSSDSTHKPYVTG